MATTQDPPRSSSTFATGVAMAFVVFCFLSVLADKSAREAQPPVTTLVSSANGVEVHGVQFKDMAAWQARNPNLKIRSIAVDHGWLVVVAERVQ